MKVFVSVDMEGITGVAFTDEIDPSSKKEDYRKACEMMTREANAAIEGAFECGADSVLVCDAHAEGRNIIPELLEPRAELVRGEFRPFGMMEGIDGGFDCALFIGYHGRAGADPAVMPHSYSSRIIFRLKVNGAEFGETALNAALAGRFGIPVVFVSGDQTVCREAENAIHGVSTHITKKALSAGSISFENIKRTHQAIKEKVREAVRMRSARILRVVEPVTVELEFVRPIYADAASMMPSTERKDSRTLLIKVQDYVTAYKAFRAAFNLAYHFAY